MWPWLDSETARSGVGEPTDVLKAALYVVSIELHSTALRQVAYTVMAYTVMAYILK